MARAGASNAEVRPGAGGPATARSGAWRGGDAARRGVVLLDMVLTLALLILAFRVAWPMMSLATSPARLSAWTQEIAGLIEADRVSAARLGRPVATRIDVPAKLFVGGARGQVVKLPRDVALDVLSTADCTVDGDRFAVAFAPDGRSCGLSITLWVPAGVATRISVNWLTGLVEVTGGTRGRG